VKGQDTLSRLADDLVSSVGNLLREVTTEEDLRIGFEKLLDPIRSELGLKSAPRYEKPVWTRKRSVYHPSP